MLPHPINALMRLGVPVAMFAALVPLFAADPGSPPPIQVTVSQASLREGETLELSMNFSPAGAWGADAVMALVTRGQRVSRHRDIPLSRNDDVILETPLARAETSLTVRVSTNGWIPQKLICLAVRVSYHDPSSHEARTVLAPVPEISLLPATGELPKREMPSYRGDGVIHLITTEPAMNTFPYPTCESWRNNDEVFLESSRHPTRAGERVVMMANLTTGKERELARLAVEDTQAYGEAHVTTSTMYHTDYSRAADLLVFYDMTGHHLYTVHPGQPPVEVLHETHGTIGDPPAISRDGTKLVYYTVMPGPKESDYFSGRTSAVFTLAIDPVSGRAVGIPKLVHAFPWRKVHSIIGPADTQLVLVNHVQFNPADSTKIMYAHEGQYVRDGAYEDTRIWNINADGSDNHPLAPEMEVGKVYSHEIFGSSGKYIYAYLSGSVARIDAATGAFKAIYEMRGALRDQHVGVSPDEKWVACDIGHGLGEDTYGNQIGGLFLVEVATGKPTFLAAFPCGASHPRHIHPNFSPDGTKVGFTLAEGATFSQLAYIDVSKIVGAKP